MASGERTAFRDLMRFPRVPGHIRSTIPWTRCSMCEPDTPMARSGTFMAYNDEPTCLEHARVLVGLQKKQVQAAKALAEMDRRHSDGE